MSTAQSGRKKKFTSMIPDEFRDLFPPDMTEKQDQAEALKVYRIRERCQALAGGDSIRILMDQLQQLTGITDQHFTEVRSVLMALVRRLEEGALNGGGVVAPPALHDNYVSPPGGRPPRLKQPQQPDLGWEEGADIVDDLGEAAPEGEGDSQSPGVLQEDVDRLTETLLEHASGREDLVRVLMQNTIQPDFIDHGTLPPPQRAVDMLDQLIQAEQERRPPAG